MASASFSIAIETFEAPVSCILAHSTPGSNVVATPAVEQAARKRRRSNDVLLILVHCYGNKTG
jgi:hypothetical protein